MRQCFLPVLLFIDHTAGWDGSSGLDSCPRSSGQCQPCCEMSAVVNSIPLVLSPWQGKSLLKMSKQSCFGNAFCLWVMGLPRRIQGKASPTYVPHLLVLRVGETLESLPSFTSNLVTLIAFSGFCLLLSIPLNYQDRYSTTSSLCLGKLPQMVAPSLLRLPSAKRTVCLRRVIW